MFHLELNLVSLYKFSKKLCFLSFEMGVQINFGPRRYLNVSYHPKVFWRRIDNDNFFCTVVVKLMCTYYRLQLQKKPRCSGGLTYSLINGGSWLQPPARDSQVFKLHARNYIRNLQRTLCMVCEYHNPNWELRLKSFYFKRRPVRSVGT